MNLHHSILDVVIVGSGPYGLSLASHLRQSGVEFRIFGIPMQSWRTAMPKGMFLKSEGFASSLSDPNHDMTLGSYCASRNLSYSDIGLPVPIETFINYGLAFQKRLVPDVEPSKVIAISQGQRLFNVRLDTGEEVLARKVVIAVGTTYFAHTPRLFASLPSELASHSRDHCDFRKFSGKQVAVIGGGQSALETAALLYEQGAHVRLLVREPMLAWNQFPRKTSTAAWTLMHPSSPLGPGWKNWFYSNVPGGFQFLPPKLRASIVRSALGPAGACWLKDRVDGRLPISLAHTVQRAEEKAGKVLLSIARPDGSMEQTSTDHLIAATGYKVDVRSLSFLDNTLLGRINVYGTAPVLSSRFESSIPGLFFTGLVAAQQFGPSLRFVAGADYAARRISHACRRPVSRGQPDWQTGDLNSQTRRMQIQR